MVVIFGGIGVKLLSDSKAATVPNGTAQLYMTPATSNVTQGQQVSVDVKIKTGASTLNAVGADITYPTSDLEFVGSSNVCSDPPFGVTADNSATSGTIKLACGSTAGFSGDYSMATLTFKALGNSGTANLVFATTSEALTQQDATNQLGSMVGASIALVAQPPTITTITPGTGTSLGGTTVTITGTNFVGTPSVKFGTASATSVTLVNGTTITAVSPAGTPGPTAISVIVGSQTATKSAAFTYNDVTAPGKPGTPTLGSKGSSSITINWSAAVDTGGSGVAGYRVYRNGSLLNSTTQPGLSYTDSSLSASTTYSYTVAAVDGAGNTGQQSATLSATTTSKGDIDGNGKIELADLSRLLNKFNQTVPGDPADINQDGKVNLTDLSILLANYGK